MGKIFNERVGVRGTFRIRWYVRKLWGLHSVSFTLLAHSERPRLIGGSEVSMEKKTEREKIDRSNQSGSILF